MKVLRMRSWNFHAENLDQMTRFYQNALGRGGAHPTHRGRCQSQPSARR